MIEKLTMVPLEKEPIFEGQYDAEMDLDKSVKEKLYSHPASVVVCVYAYDWLTAEVCGLPVLDFLQLCPETPDVEGHEDALYCSSVMVLPHFEKRGLGGFLMRQVAS